MSHLKERNGKSFIFYLNMQIIVDELQDYQIMFQYCPGDTTPRLTHVKVYNNRQIPDYHQVSIIRAEDFDSTLASMSNASFIVLGACPKSITCLCSAIFILTPMDIFEVLDIVQNVFEYNAQWAGNLQTALIEDYSLDEICQISQPYFNNPIFIHSPQYYILGSSGWIPGMSEWDHDKITGRSMISADLINNFKTDPEYMETMTTRGAHIYSGNFRSFRCAYVNLWDSAGSYEGRLCINELLSSLKPGQFHSMEYFSQIITAFFRKNSTKKRSVVRPFEDFLRGLLEGTVKDMFLYDTVLSRQGWKQYDRYVCIKVTMNDDHMGTGTITSTCNLIRAQFHGSAAFYYKNSILVVINMSLPGSTPTINDCLSQLSPIVREGLLKAGSSNEFGDLALLPQFYIQADLALTYGNQNDATKWCHRFQEVALSYCVHQACQQLDARFICAPDLIRLQEYDDENESDLYNTLKIYLQNDRNATKTAQILYIHRSTLFYRLDKIKKLIELNLDQINDSLYLRLSFYMMEINDKKTE